MAPPRKRGSEELDPEVLVPEQKSRRIHLGQLGRRFVPAGTLVGSTDAVIVSLAVPTKKDGFIKFNVDSDGQGSKAGPVTRDAFLAENSEVAALEVKASLSDDKSITPRRLASKVRSVKRKADKVEEDRKGDTLKDVEEPTAKVPKVVEEEDDIVDDVELDISDLVAEEDVVNVEEEIVKMSGEKSEDPLDRVYVPRDRSNLKLKEGYIDRLWREMDEEKDVAKSKLMFEELNVLTEALEAAAAARGVTDFTNLPPVVEEIEEDDIAEEEAERKRIVKDTIEKVEKAAIDKDSADNLLSGDTTVNVETTNAETSAHADVEMGAVVDPVNVTAVEESTSGNEILTPMDIDTTNPSEADNTLLGHDASKEYGHTGTNTGSNPSSANAIEQVVADMEQVNPTTEEKQHTKEHAKELATVEKEEAKMDVSPSAEEADVAEQARMAAILAPSSEQINLDKEQVAELDKTLAAVGVGAGIPGFENAVRIAFERGHIQDIDSMSDRKKILAILQKNSKMQNIMTTAAPTSSEILTADVMAVDVGVPGVLGTSGVGTPVFVPGTARDSLTQMMNGVATLTEKEKNILQSEMSPLWSEFKLGRLAAGVREMERMPSRIIKDPKSSVQVGSKVQEGESQEDVTFGRFMFWLLHTRLNSSNMSTWRSVLLYSSALGYNSLTQAQINWIVTGDKNGDLGVDVVFPQMEEDGVDPLDQSINIRGQIMTMTTLKSLDAQIVGSPEPQGEYPTKNTSPSAAPVDNSIHPDGTTGPQRQNRQSFRGMPTRISNIPDPRFSMRGGEEVPNIRITTIKNPKFDPSKDPNAVGYEPEFKTIHDVGAGSKDIGAHIAASVADRLLRSMPTKLYAPIHAQACDRYLGAINFQRLSMPIEKYMSSYSQHPWGPTDFQQMHEWNIYSMALYGQMLYAFVTDIQMQRTSPVFDMSTPEAVGFEYMELNELLSELARYQQNAEDRSGRIGDTGSDKRPVEDHLDKFKDDNIDDKLAMFGDPNVVMISSPVTPFPSAADVPDPIAEPEPPVPETRPETIFRGGGTVSTSAPIIRTGQVDINNITSDMNTGVRKQGSNTSSTLTFQQEQPKLTLFGAFSGRSSMS